MARWVHQLEGQQLRLLRTYIMQIQRALRGEVSGSTLRSLNYAQQYATDAADLIQQYIDTPQVASDD